MTANAPAGSCPPAKASRPLLRWAGSKRQLLGTLRGLLPNREYTYVEPFCGSAALFFETAPGRAILADVNLDLMNFYKHCQTSPHDVYDLARRIRRTERTYYKIRTQICDTPFDAARAAYFYYLNRNCFNGLYRTNKNGEFNVPFSPSRTGRMLTRDEFASAAAILKNATLSTDDFETTIERSKGAKAFFFIDPPYAIARRRPFTDYAKNSFSKKDVPRLLGCLEAIDDSAGLFILTYDARLAGAFALRSTWKQQKIVIRRNISGFAGARRNATEIVTTNF